MTKNSFKNYFLILIITAVFSVAGLLPLGVITLLIQAVLASIIGYTVTRYHYWFVSTVCMFLIAIYTTFSGNFYTAISVSLPIILCGISLGIAYNVKISEFKTVSILTGVHTLYFLLNIKLLGVDSLVNILADSKKLYVDAFASVYADAIPKEQLEALISEVMALVYRFLPSIIVIFSILIALLFLYTFKKVLKITKMNTDVYKSFSEWKLDKSVGITALIVIIINFSLNTDSYFSAVLSNVCVISLFVFYIFGLAFMCSLLKKKVKNQKLLKAVMFFLALLPVLSPGLPFLMISSLGIVDTCFNFRKLPKNDL